LFLRKLEALASEWGKKSEEMEEIRKESLLYGMRLKTTPTGLKNALRKGKLDTKVATPLWSGNAYLLLSLPKVLTNPKSKIPCLEDFIYAKSVLEAQQIGTLKKKIDNIPPEVDRDQFLKKMMPFMKRKAYRARFLSMLDPSIEKDDIQQDMMIEMLRIFNKEITNLNTHKSEGIEKYFINCFSQKVKTYLGKTKPKQFRMMVETEIELECLLESGHQKEEATWLDKFYDPLVQQDLRGMLTWEQMEALYLLIGLPDAEHTARFEEFLRRQGLKREELSLGKLKHAIQKFLEAPDVFDEILEHRGLKNYFQERDIETSF